MTINLLILELMKQRFNAGQRSNMFYWRDSSGNEIDILIDQASQVIPVEIKTAATFNSDFLKGINYWRKINPNTKKSYLLYTGKAASVSNTDVLNWKDIESIKN